MMTILAISDLHGYLPDIPECDLLLLGGDYAKHGTRDRSMQLRYMRGEFADWLNRIPARHIVGIGGNHDFVLEEWPELVRDLPWVYLKDEMADVEGVKIYGTPWTPKFGPWAFMQEDWKLQHKFAHIPKDLDILLTHGPAYGILDRSIYDDRCGSRYLLEKVKELKVSSHVFGHIHEARGIEDNGITRSFNVAHVDVHYEPKFGPVHIPLKG